MSFLWAPQPELLRASQKDASSLAALRTEVKDIAHELFRHRAVTADAEIDLFCALAYYGLPMSAGERTLGEEYCDILAVSGASSAANTNQATLLVDTRGAHSPLTSAAAEEVLYGPPPPPSLTTMTASLPEASPLPDVSSSSLTPVSAEVAASDGETPQRASRELLRESTRPLQLPHSSSLAPPTPLARGLFILLTAVAPYIAAKWTPAAPPTLALPRARPVLSSSGGNRLGPVDEADEQHGQRLGVLQRLRALLALTRARTSHLLAVIAAYVKYALRRTLFLAHTWLPRAEACNLFLFYLFGVYATLPHRLTGRRYLALSRPTHRTRFGALALLLLLRGALAAVRAVWAARARALRRAGWEQRRRARACVKQEQAVETRRLTRRMRWRQQGMLARARALARGATAAEAADSAAKAEADAEAADAANEEAAFADLRSLEPFLAAVDAEAEAAGGADALEAAAAAEEDEGGAVVGGHVLGDAVQEKKAAAQKDDIEDSRPSVICSICMGETAATAATECGHLFCWDCGAQALRREQRCPTCRADCKVEGLMRLHQYK